MAEEIGVLMLRRRMKGAVELAEKIGMSQSAMSRRMVGDQAFDLDELDRIAEALGVGIVDLLPRDRRNPTSQYGPGTVVDPVLTPHPGHPIPGAVTLPRPVVRPRLAPAAEQRRVVLTAPRDLSPSL